MDLSTLSDADFNALQAGDLKSMSDEGFAQLMKAQSASMPHSERAQLNLEADKQRYAPTVGMSGPQLFNAAMGKSVADTGMALGQMLPGGPNRADVDAMRRRDAPLMSTGAGKAGYVTGAGLQAVPAMMTPMANSVAGASVLGGLFGAATPVGTGDDPLKNALLGGLGGGVSALGANALSRLAQPVLKPGTQNLMDSGITLTPGQRMGGAWKRAEDAMTSVPVAGDFIRNAQRRSFEDFNAAVANKALAPIGDKLPKGVIGRDAIGYVERKIGDAYDSALRQIKTVPADATFNSELTSLKQMVGQSTMPKDVQSQFYSAIKNQIEGKFMGQSTMTAQTFKDAESELGRLATKYAGDASADKQLLGDALQEAQASLRRLLERSAGPDLAGDVKAANAGWAEFKRMQRASTFLGAKDGVFSPENYMNAVKALDRTKDKSAFARGSALGQDLGADAVRVMGGTVPDSGTPFRSLMADPIKGTVAAVLPGAAVGPAYSPRMQAALQALMTGKRPPLATKLAAEIEAAKPALAAMGFTGVNALNRLGGQ